MDYLLVKRNFRNPNRKKLGYLTFSEYIKFLETDGGLTYIPIAPFIIPSGYSAFVVTDERKAFTFYFKYGEYCQRPDIEEEHKA